MSDAFLLGVDGGNSKTIAVIVTGQGEIAGIARGAGSDIYGRETPTVALEELARVVNLALMRAGIAAHALGTAAFSLAGADWPEDFVLLERELTARLDLAVAPVIVNDAMGALRSGTVNWEGVAVACGTFNAIGARHRNGATFHFGAWPDRVGGYDLGRQALDAAYREGLGIGPKTALTQRALETYNVADATELMHAFTRLEGRVAPKDVQRMSPVLLDEADAGDPVAVAIVAAGGRTLGSQARAAAQRVGLAIEGLPVVLTGGVFEHPSDLLAEAVMEHLRGAIAIRTRSPPVVGALLLAFDAAGQTAYSEALAASVSKALAQPQTR